MGDLSWLPADNELTDVQRTFLAWLRTSLALASVGVAISQLFRLSASVYTLSDLPDVPTSTTSSGTITEQQLVSAVASLSAIVQRQTEQLRSLGSSVDSERSRYYTLGRPVGGTFVLMGFVFMLLGAFSGAGFLPRSYCLLRRRISVPLCPASPDHTRHVSTSSSFCSHRFLPDRCSRHRDLRLCSPHTVVSAILKHGSSPLVGSAPTLDRISVG